VTRVKLVRRVIEERGGRCEVLDIGPNRRLVRPGCIPVLGGVDYLAKVARFARRGFTVHSHVNGEYFRGLLLALAAGLLARACSSRYVVTFHAGTVQPFFNGWRRRAMAPLFRSIFLMAHVVICNSEAVRRVLGAYVRSGKVAVVPAFSVQYLSYRSVSLEAGVERFLTEHHPLVSTYLCFRDGFFTDTVLEALPRLVALWPSLGLVIVGTGPEQDAFERRLSTTGLSRNVMLVGDLGHDAFMTLIKRTAVHLRTPVTDGVSATVLEALSLRVPVVASDNGSRPEGVITYPAADAGAMVATLDHALRHRADLVRSMPPLSVADTAATESDLLLDRPTAASSPAVETPSRTAARGRDDVAQALLDVDSPRVGDLTPSR
jgi:hypothetical protein